MIDRDKDRFAADGYIRADHAVTQFRFRVDIHRRDDGDAFSFGGFRAVGGAVFEQVAVGFQQCFGLAGVQPDIHFLHAQFGAGTRSSG